MPNHEREAIAVELAKLIAAFPSQDPGVSADLRIAAYFEALEGFPVAAVCAAREKINRGLVADLNKAFAPTPAQFADVVRKIVSPANPFRTQLGDQLRAERADRAAGKLSPPQPEKFSEKMRVVDGFEKLKQDIRANGDHHWHDDPETSLRKRAQALGLDYETAMKSIPDARA